MSKNLSLLVLCILLVVPFTLHSTDIYTSSHGKIKVHANLNSHIIPGDPKLSGTVLVLSAPIEQKDIHIVTPCEHTESVLHKEPVRDEKMLYIIRIAFPSSCETTVTYVGDRENIFTDTFLSLPMKSLSNTESDFINTGSDGLLPIMRTQSLALAEKTGTGITEKLQRLQALYKNLSIGLESDIAQNILQDRENTKYLSPVAGYALPNKDKLIPGTGRPYRRDTTDGIHHGWDIMAPIGTPVQSLAKGKIIRIVNNWNWGKFNTLKR